MSLAFFEILIATGVFVGGHFLLSSGGPRGLLVGRIGETGFRGIYSVVALGSLVWMAIAYGRAPAMPLWDRAVWQTWVTVVLLLPTLVLLVGGVSAPNPTAMGQGGGGLGRETARGILRITRNPVMWAIGLWALAHLPPNGDLASLVFFGGIAGLALAGSVVLDAKNARRRGEAWTGFATATSNLPFAAVAAGRQDAGVAAAEFGLVRAVVALALFVALIWGHPWLFGVPAIPV